MVMATVEHIMSKATKHARTLTTVCFLSRAIPNAAIMGIGENRRCKRNRQFAVFPCGGGWWLRGKSLLSSGCHNASRSSTNEEIQKAKTSIGNMLQE